MKGGERHQTRRRHSPRGVMRGARAWSDGSVGILEDLKVVALEERNETSILSHQKKAKLC